MKESNKHRKNTRSFGGCVTCRSRRVKCDEKRPKCTPCARARTDCKGYDVCIGFVHYTPVEGNSKCYWKQDGRHHSRQLLFSEDQRASMSDYIIQIVEDEGPDVLLERVEKQRYSAFQNDEEYRPFGMLMLSQPCCDELHFLGPAEPMVQKASTESSGSQSISDLGVTTQPLNLDGLLEIDNGFTSQNQDLDIFHGGDRQISAWIDCTELNYLDPHFLTIPSQLVNSATEAVPPGAQFLLNHYKEQMGRLFSPLRVRKSPWEVLHYPSAMTALSELSLFNKTSHSKGAVLFALLAVSAYHVDKVSTSSSRTSSYWWQVGEMFQAKAKCELQFSLNNELDGAFKAKYKDLLMAILTMVTISVVNGQQGEARSFLLNAELFICRRGIPKRVKSRKVKLLHHIYLFLRVIEESTHVYPTEWLQSQPVPALVHCSNMQFPSLRTHSFGVGRDLDEFCGGDFELGLVADPEAEPGTRDSTLFGHIYGIPEKLLAYISQTTALANECTAFDMDMSARYDELRAKIKGLENEICSWKFNEGAPYFDIEESSTEANSSIMTHLIRAIHSAILLFFYRRVRWMNPLILQPYVEKTLDHLYAHEQEKITSSVINAGIVWPGFIAAVEASEPHLQQRAYSWLRDCAERTGMRNFDVAADFAQELWAFREERGDPDVPWTELVRERQHVLVLT